MCVERERVYMYMYACWGEGVCMGGEGGGEGTCVERERVYVHVCMLGKRVCV